MHRETTIRETLAWLRQYFLSHAIPTPRLEAELLLSDVLGRSRIELYTKSEESVKQSDFQQITLLANRRVDGEPMAYLVGEKEFYSLPMTVTPAVLIPRPETEILVEKAILFLDQKSKVWPAGMRILEVGTGSGAIAVVLKKERPALQVVAVDRSREALRVAKKNADRFGLSIELIQADLTNPFAKLGCFHFIISNPPYIPSKEIATLSKEVKREPWMALDGGADGLLLIRRLLKESLCLLKMDGGLMMEVGQGQAEIVATEMEQCGYGDIEITKDLSKIPRIVFGKRMVF